MKAKQFYVIMALVIALSLAAAIVPAGPALADPGTTTTVTLPSNVYRPAEFIVSSTTTNSGAAYSNVRFNITVSGPVDFAAYDRADVFTITKLNGGVDTQGINETFVHQDGDFVGYWGPPGGFPLPDSYTATSTFTIQMDDVTTAPLGNYDLTVELVDLTPDPDVTLATATDSFSLSDDTLYVGTTEYQYQFNTIQSAIDASSADDTINVAAGNYTENVDVDKSLTLTGASSATVTVNAADASDPVFFVNANSVDISGFTVSGATVAGRAGIYLNAGVSLCNINDNIASGNWDGIWLGQGSNNNTLTNNNVSGSLRQGFEVYVSDNNTFTSNIANSSGHYGFKIDSGSNNEFTNNIANSNGRNGFFSVTGDGGGCVDATFTGNIANLNNQYGIRISGGNGITLTGNTFDSNVVAGIRVKEAEAEPSMLNLTIENNNITNNPIGFEVNIDADPTTDVSTWAVNYNNIAGNTNYGISNAATVGTLDATCNWWGDATGPYHDDSNLEGLGSAVSDNVIYCKWLDAEWDDAPNEVGLVYDETQDTWYCTIQDAIDGANPGDTIVLMPGKYVENLVIDKSLTVKSSTGDWRDVDLDEPPGHGITISGAGHVTVQGLEISDFPGDGIHITNIQHGGSVSILDCFIHENFGSGIWGDNLDGLLHIEGNIISENGGGGPTGVHLEDVGSETTGGTVVVTDNVIGAWYGGEGTWSGNDGDGIKVQHIWPMSTVTIGSTDHIGWMFSEENIGPDNIIAQNDGDGIDVEYLEGSLNIVGNNIGAWDFDLEGGGWVGGNHWDGIEITETSPGSSAVIRDNAISESGIDDSDGIEIEYVNGSVDILDNIIGAWTYYEYDGGEVDGEARFWGNLEDGINLYDVDGTVLIDGNKIAENGGPFSGIHIGSIEMEDAPGSPLVGSVTISNNDIGEWEDAEGETNYGNAGHGIYVSYVQGGCTLIIGPDNNIVRNLNNDGIDIAHGDMGATITIHHNVIDDNGSAYSGIELGDGFVAGATISWNTITNQGKGICVDGNSNQNAIINNTLTDNDNAIYIGTNSHHNGIVGNLISGNGRGIWVNGWQNDILCNVITGNDQTIDSGVHFGWIAVDNVVNHNNIVGNSNLVGSYGVFNDNTSETVDARWNWWGSSSGPYHGGTNPGGEGDSVSNDVDYEPWATSAFPYTIMPYDTDMPDILTAVAMPDVVSWYSLLEEYTSYWDPWEQYEEEFGFTTGPTDGRCFVETNDINEEDCAARGIRYVTLDLEGAVAQLLGVQDVWDVQPPEWVTGPEWQDNWLSEWHWYLSMVDWWSQMEFEKDCGVWFKNIFLEFTFNMLYGLYFDESAGYSKLMQMLQPGEFHIGVTVQDWAGNTKEGTIEIALVDIAIPLEQDWNLRSTPIDLGVDTWGGITHLGTDLDDYMGSALKYEIAYRWDPVTEDWTQLLDDYHVRPLEGIAIKMCGRDAIGLVFDRGAPGMPTLQLHEGWNPIGLAVGPPDDPWMPVDDALISIEEIVDGVRGYIIVDSPGQYLEYVEEWHWCDGWSMYYDWYFGQQDWNYQHPGADRPQPAPDMTTGGVYWVYMERDDTLAGFSSTPIFLKLFIERGEDLEDVPRYPGTTMVWYEDWLDWWAFGYEIESRWGLQWTWITYKGAFAVEEVLPFYIDEMPDYDWQMCTVIYEGDSGGIGFWKEGEHGGVPYYTDVCRIWAEEINGIGYIEVFHNPVDVPTVPGTALILWESMWPFGNTTYMEYQGAVVPQEGINYFMSAMSDLQWEAVDYYEAPFHYIEAYFEKPVSTPWGVEWMYVDVYAYFPQGLPWNVEQPVIIHVERYPADMP